MEVESEVKAEAEVKAEEEEEEEQEAEIEVKAKAETMKEAEVKAERLGLKAEVEEEVKAEVETIKESEVEEGGGAIPRNLCNHNFLLFSLDRDPMDGSVGRLVVNMCISSCHMVDIGHSSRFFNLIFCFLVFFR